MTKEYIDKYLIIKENKIYYRIGRCSGKLAKSKSCAGYLKVKIEHKYYMQHRIIWFYYKGYIPTQLDHIDGDKTNNNINNLRECTSKENRCNTRRKPNKVGIKGIYFDKQNKRLRAEVMLGGKRIRKRFLLSQKDKAIEWVTKMRTLLHGEFANHN